MMRCCWSPSASTTTTTTTASSKGLCRVRYLVLLLLAARISTKNIIGSLTNFLPQGIVDNQRYLINAGSATATDNNQKTDDEYPDEEEAEAIVWNELPLNATTDVAGACLLMKDDNHWLTEWLAFHYHVLPLRHLIVAVDPASRTSPSRILQKWNDTGKIQIQVWRDADFLPHIPTGMYKQAQYKNNSQLLYHRHRQGSFYEACLQVCFDLSLFYVCVCVENLKYRKCISPHSSNFVFFFTALL